MNRRRKPLESLGTNSATTGLLRAPARPPQPAGALAGFALPLHRSRRIGVGLLPVDAPVAQFVERDRLAGDGAAHVRARTDNAKIAVEKFNFRFA